MPGEVLLQTTCSGLRIILPAALDWRDACAALGSRLGAAPALPGVSVSVVPGDGALRVEQLSMLEGLLIGQHHASLVEVVSRAALGAAPAGAGGSALARSGQSPAATAVSGEGEAVPDTLLVRRTLRSGQHVRFARNVVVLGDVNPGAEIVAGGDIVVIGTLRGVAHAGAAGDLRAVVAAFRLQPTQIRVAAVIGRAPDGGGERVDAPEVALVRDGLLVIQRLAPVLAELG